MTTRTSDLARALATYLKPERRDVFALLGYEPSPKQQEFHAATEFDVLYGGAAGGGKSYALVAHGLRAADWYPGIRIGVFRRSYDELQESITPVLQHWGYGEALGARWNANDREIRFPNGSVIRLRYLEALADASRRQGGGYQMLLIDERTQMVPGAVEQLMERLRTGTASGIPVLGVRSTSNPGGSSHGQVKQRYIDATDYGSHVYTDEFGLTVRFIPALVTDNPHVDPGYKARLDAIPDPQRRAAMRFGSWDSFSGQVFSEWNRDLHVVHPWALPKEWERYMAVDWGYTAPWCVLWGAVDEDGRLWVYRELYDTQVGEHDQARRILEAENEDEEPLRVGDPAMWAQRGDAEAISTAYGDEGVYLDKANNDRLGGWQRVHSYLASGPACPHHRAQGLAVCPKLHIFANCSNLIRTLPTLPYSQQRTEDVDCFVAGTLVDTLRGLRPIETLRVGDLVHTPIGPQPVIKDGISGWGEVWRVPLSTGAVLEGTRRHKVYVRGRGLVRLDNLKAGDILEPRIRCTRSRSIETFGAWLLPLRAFTSTISTAILRTTIRATSWCSALATMRYSTSESVMLTLCGRQPCTAGTAPQPVPSSYAETLRRCWRTRQNADLRAGIVERLLRRDRRRQRIARLAAHIRLGWLVSQLGRASSAAGSSERSTRQQSPVRIAAAGTIVGVRWVYNLTVARARLYYANGVLVTNTHAEDHAGDALRYLLMAIGTGAEFHILDELEPRTSPLDGSPLVRVGPQPTWGIPIEDEAPWLS